MDGTMKTIVYRGGLVSFGIPSDWREEYEPEGGGTFYEDVPNSGTLRLNVLTFEGKEEKSYLQVIRAGFGADGYEILPCGFALRYRVIASTERGVALRLYRWEVLVPVSPTRFRVACFTHTVLAREERTERTRRELGIVDSSVRSAEFSTALGVHPCSS